MDAPWQFLTSKTMWAGFGDAMETFDIFTAAAPPAPGARSSLYYDAALEPENTLTALAWSPKGNTNGWIVITVFMLCDAHPERAATA
jgi:hypothetical protein